MNFIVAVNYEHDMWIVMVSQETGDFEAELNGVKYDLTVVGQSSDYEDALKLRTKLMEDKS